MNENRHCKVAFQEAQGNKPPFMLEAYKLCYKLYKLQHGFHDKRSCETQLIEFIPDVSTNMQNGIQTDICILDFKSGSQST